MYKSRLAPLMFDGSPWNEVVPSFQHSSCLFLSHTILLSPHLMSLIPGDEYISSCRCPLLMRYSMALKSFLSRPIAFSNSVLQPRPSATTPKIKITYFGTKLTLFQLTSHRSQNALAPFQPSENYSIPQLNTTHLAFRPTNPQTLPI